MKMKKGFLNHKLDNDNYLVPTNETVSNFHGVVRNNETTAFIIDCLQEDTTEEKIVEKMCEIYDATPERIYEGVEYVIDRLRSINALDE